MLEKSPGVSLNMRREGLRISSTPVVARFKSCPSPALRAFPMLRILLEKLSRSLCITVSPLPYASKRVSSETFNVWAFAKVNTKLVVISLYTKKQRYIILLLFSLQRFYIFTATFYKGFLNKSCYLLSRLTMKFISNTQLPRFSVQKPGDDSHITVILQ